MGEGLTGQPAATLSSLALSLSLSRSLSIYIYIYILYILYIYYDSCEIGGKNLKDNAEHPQAGTLGSLMGI